MPWPKPVTYSVVPPPRDISRIVYTQYNLDQEVVTSGARDLKMIVNNVSLGVNEALNVRSVNQKGSSLAPR